MHEQPLPTGRSLHRGLRYGVDGPPWPLFLGLATVVLLAAGLITRDLGLLIAAAVIAIEASIYLHTTLRGKFRAWEKLIAEAELGGDEQILDLGCGRGAVLLIAAARLDRGRAHGIDLWRSIDQSGNKEATTWHNAEIEGVADRVELHTGDITQLPFADGTFDLVLSSLVIHNIRDAGGRDRALDEALRVMRPGGRLLLVDAFHVGDYADHLRDAGAAAVQRRRLGPDFWYSGPWTAGSLVTATKPS